MIWSRRVFGTVMLLAGMGATTVSAAETTFRITLQLPITAPFGQNLEFFEEEVERASDGDIAVEIYPSAQLFTDKEVPVAVATGQIEMGVAFTNRFAGLIPAVEVFSVPFLLDDLSLVRAATTPGSAVRAPLDQAMTERGMRPLWWMPYGFAVILTRDVPVRLPEDLEGMKIRTFGKAYEELIRLLGGAATNIPGSEQYLAYERGTVDGGMTGVMGVKDRKLYQVLGYLTRVNVGAIAAAVIVNDRFWQGLDEESRTIIAEAARAAEVRLHDRIGGILESSYAAAREGGMTIIDPTEAERAVWREATQPLHGRFLAETGPLGAEVLGAARALRADMASD